MVGSRLRDVGRKPDPVYGSTSVYLNMAGTAPARKPRPMTRSTRFVCIIQLTGCFVELRNSLEPADLRCLPACRELDAVVSTGACARSGPDTAFWEVWTRLW